MDPLPLIPLIHIFKDRAAWLEARKDGLGASDAASILGISPWKTNVQLWQEKTELVVPEDIGDKPYVQYGNDAEPLLRQFFALDHPEYGVSFTPFQIIANPEMPFITCTPDGELVELDTDRRGGLEIKTTESCPPLAGLTGMAKSRITTTPRCATKCLPRAGSSWNCWYKSSTPRRTARIARKSDITKLNEQTPRGTSTSWPGRKRRFGIALSAGGAPA